jgi:hypothetical protein
VAGASSLTCFKNVRKGLISQIQAKAIVRTHFEQTFAQTISNSCRLNACSQELLAILIFSQLVS